MVVKKAELVSSFTGQQKAEIAALESKIDQKLRSDYAGDRVIVDISNWPHAKVRQEIERLYKEAGWKIRFESDQRDGNWIELS